jgi:tRNA uridine 5-carbamoylmethylation protein Kti12
LDVIDDFFMQVLNSELDASRKSGDLERIGKLQQIMGVIQQASTAPPEINLIQDLVEEPDEGNRRRMLEENQEQIDQDFFQILSGLISQLQESNQDPELLERLKSVNRLALRFSMESISRS